MTITVETLRAVRALLEAPDRWTQDWFAKAANGEQVTYDDPDAVCFCLLGAVCRVGSSSDASDFHVALGFSRWGEVAAWNDDPARTHAEILARLDDAIERMGVA